MALRGAKLVPFESQMLLSELCYPWFAIRCFSLGFSRCGIAAGSRSAAVSPSLQAAAMSHPQFLQCARKYLSVLGGIYCQSCGALEGSLDSWC